MDSQSHPEETPVPGRLLPAPTLKHDSSGHRRLKKGRFIFAGSWRLDYFTFLLRDLSKCTELVTR